MRRFNAFSFVASCAAVVILLTSTSALAQSAPTGGSSLGGVLNIIFLGLIAYFLVRAFRKRSGRNDPSQENKWKQDNDNSAAGPTRQSPPMDRYEAARQMWSVLSSDPQQNENTPLPEQGATASGFNESEFLEGAKLFYTRIQQINEQSELDELSSLLSTDVHARLLATVDGRERTQVMLLDARVMENNSENGHTVLSVFYDAQLRVGAEGERTVHSRDVWEFSRDDASDGAFWILEQINKVDQ